MSHVFTKKDNGGIWVIKRRDMYMMWGFGFTRIKEKAALFKEKGTAERFAANIPGAKVVRARNQGNRLGY
jgi:hypothetical protein